MSVRSGFKLTARDLRVAKLGKKTGPGLCGREIEAYLNCIGKLGSEAKIPVEIVTALTTCINAPVRNSHNSYVLITTTATITMIIA